MKLSFACIERFLGDLIFYRNKAYEEHHLHKYNISCNIFLRYITSPPTYSLSQKKACRKTTDNMELKSLETQFPCLHNLIPILIIPIIRNEREWRSSIRFRHITANVNLYAELVLLFFLLSG